MFDKPKDTLQLIVHESDIPFIKRGSLIPGAFTPSAVGPRRRQARRVVVSWPQVGRVVMVGVSMFLLAVVGTVTFGLIERNSQVASPVVTLVDPHTLAVSSLDYGPQTALAQQTFYTETRAAFIADGVTFLDLDFTRQQLRYFDSGVLIKSTPITAIAAPSSWWETPAGLYQITDKRESFFSNVAQAEFPWTLVFEENFVVHGQPLYPDGSPVADSFLGGGVRLENTAAEALFKQVRPGTPVLVHQITTAPDNFVYEPPAPEITAEHYFVADLDTGAVLAASDSDQEAPIASITKLMTAVVAAEELSLDDRVLVASPSFVTSLVPRLESRSSVSMYSLLQLLLVESSNEAAEVIASQLGRTEFIDLMNQKARQLGMLNTTFTDPSGLDAGNVSTVGDLYRLVQYIDENRSFIIDITRDVNLPSAYEGGDFSGLINFNEIEDVAGFAGGKVGETRAAGQTSVSLHELSIRDSTRTIVVIVLGSEARTADVETLVSFIETQFGG